MTPSFHTIKPNQPRNQYDLLLYLLSSYEHHWKQLGLDIKYFVLCRSKDHDSNLMFIGLVQLIDSASTSSSISIALALVSPSSKETIK